jgi:hypothetical protein
MSIEAMKQALEALNEVTGWQWAGPMRVMDEVEDAITALHQAIEQAEKQEPVAWLSSGEARMIHWKTKHPGFGDDWIPLYTSPPPRQQRHISTSCR